MLQADGGTRPPPLRVSLALRLALKEAQSGRESDPGSYVGRRRRGQRRHREKRALLDLCYTEDAAASVDLNLVMNAAGELIELQGTGEESTFSETELAKLLALGKSEEFATCSAHRKIPWPTKLRPMSLFRW